MDKQQPTCADRWEEHKASRLDAIESMLRYESRGREDPENGPFFEYGLAFDYVAPNTFRDQKEGYWRYQLSWGGPSDEIRFYSSGPKFKPHRIEYWFLDWWDGHGEALQGNDLKVAMDVWDIFDDCGVIKQQYDEAQEYLPDDEEAF